MKTINVKQRINSYCFVSYTDANVICDEIIRIRKEDKNEPIQIDFSEISIISSGLFEHLWEQYYREFKDKESNITVINVDSKENYNEIFSEFNDKEYKARIELDKYYLEHPEFAPLKK